MFSSLRSESDDTAAGQDDEHGDGGASAAVGGGGAAAPAAALGACAPTLRVFLITNGEVCRQDSLRFLLSAGSDAAGQASCGMDGRIALRCGVALAVYSFDGIDRYHRMARAFGGDGPKLFILATPLPSADAMSAPCEPSSFLKDGVDAATLWNPGASVVVWAIAPPGSPDAGAACASLVDDLQAREDDLRGYIASLSDAALDATARAELAARGSARPRNWRPEQAGAAFVSPHVSADAAEGRYVRRASCLLLQRAAAAGGAARLEEAVPGGARDFFERCGSEVLRSGYYEDPPRHLLAVAKLLCLLRPAPRGEAGAEAASGAERTREHVAGELRRADQEPGGLRASDDEARDVRARQALETAQRQDPKTVQRQRPESVQLQDPESVLQSALPASAQSAPPENVQSAPTGSVLQNAPPESVQSAPPESVQQNAPQESVQSAPSESVQQSAPPESVLQTAPPESVQTAPPEGVPPRQARAAPPLAPPPDAIPLDSGSESAVRRAASAYLPRVASSARARYLGGASACGICKVPECGLVRSDWLRRACLDALGLAPADLEECLRRLQATGAVLLPPAGAAEPRWIWADARAFLRVAGALLPARGRIAPLERARGEVEAVLLGLRGGGGPPLPLDLCGAVVAALAPLFPVRLAGAGGARDPRVLLRLPLARRVPARRLLALGAHRRRGYALAMQWELHCRVPKELFAELLLALLPGARGGAGHPPTPTPPPLVDQLDLYEDAISWREDLFRGAAKEPMMANCLLCHSQSTLHLWAAIANAHSPPLWQRYALGDLLSGLWAAVEAAMAARAPGALVVERAALCPYCMRADEDYADVSAFRKYRVPLEIVQACAGDHAACPSNCRVPLAELRHALGGFGGGGGGTPLGTPLDTPLGTPPTAGGAGIAAGGGGPVGEEGKLSRRAALLGALAEVRAQASALRRAYGDGDGDADGVDYAACGRVPGGVYSNADLEALANDLQEEERRRRSFGPTVQIGLWDSRVRKVRDVGTGAFFEPPAAPSGGAALPDKGPEGGAGRAGPGGYRGPVPGSGSANGGAPGMHREAKVEKGPEGGAERLLWSGTSPLVITAAHVVYPEEVTDGGARARVRRYPESADFRQRLLVGLPGGDDASVWRFEARVVPLEGTAFRLREARTFLDLCVLEIIGELRVGPAAPGPALVALREADDPSLVWDPPPCSPLREEEASALRAFAPDFVIASGGQCVLLHGFGVTPLNPLGSRNGLTLARGVTRHLSIREGRGGLPPMAVMEGCGSVAMYEEVSAQHYLDIEVTNHGQGMSGGPIVSAEGRLLAVYSRFTRDAASGQSESHGVRLQSIEAPLRRLAGERARLREAGDTYWTSEPLPSREPPVVPAPRAEAAPA